MIDLHSINPINFDKIALSIFNIQYQKVEIYRRYCDELSINKQNINKLEQIPFLPIELYKKYKVLNSDIESETYFESSGTSNMIKSRHYFNELKEYNTSIDIGFQKFFGNYSDYVIIGLLPHYMEIPNSSLVYMVDRWMSLSSQNKKEYFLYEFDLLYNTIVDYLLKNYKVLLIGLTSALFEFSEKYNISNKDLTIIETGGNKSKTKNSYTKLEIFDKLNTSFPNSKIHSEYGMCELFSQFYTTKNTRFSSPPTAKILVSDINDPLHTVTYGRGIAKIIDLSNYNTCSFIHTNDIVEVQKNGDFEILGRKDNSDIRGCSILY